MITDDTSFKKKNQKKKRRMVTFNEEEIIINPEDVDPTVGRFRNLVQTTVVPTSSKRMKLDHFLVSSSSSENQKPFTTQQPYMQSLYQGLTNPVHESHAQGTAVDTSLVGTFGSKFLILPNPAPEVTTDIISTTTTTKGNKKSDFNQILFTINFAWSNN